MGIWGINIPVGWGFAIINFVWWIGIGHAGTLISAILAAAASEVADVDQPLCRGDDACSRSPAPGCFPLLHLGRPWFALLAVSVSQHDGALAAVPQPAGVGRVRGFDLLHGVAAVLVHRADLPDLATLRDRAQPTVAHKIVYGILAMGWRGSARHWHRYETAYLLLAGLATPLVVSVHTVVSFDFAVAIVPGLAHDDFPALLRRRARSTPASRWC